MKVPALLVAAVTVAVAGCASAPPAPVATDAALACNAEKMDQVQRDAARHMTEVHWVRCPPPTVRAHDS